MVLDYQMQQYRTFKALSLAYCLLWNTRYGRCAEHLRVRLPALSVP